MAPKADVPKVGAVVDVAVLPKAGAAVAEPVPNVENNPPAIQK